MNYKTIAEANTIYACNVGSHIYGTNVEGSDVDYASIFVEDKAAIFGLAHVNEVDLGTKVDKSKPNGADDIDNKAYAFRRFVELAATKSNPNVLELLFVRKNHIQYCNEYGNLLRDNRDMFITKHCYDSFVGYAKAMFHRLEQSDRNPHGGRSHIIEKYGWDCKYGMHLLRLYMEAVELLSDGELVLPLKHNRQLLDIRLGKVSKEKCLAIAEEWRLRAEEARLISKLPAKVDQKKVNDFLIDFYERYWGYNSHACNGLVIKEKLLAIANSL